MVITEYDNFNLIPNVMNEKCGLLLGGDFYFVGKIISTLCRLSFFLKNICFVVFDHL